MRAVLATGTSPEIILRRAFRQFGAAGWRQHDKSLPGTPDFVFAGFRLVVFVDGCFWHGCLSCYRAPKSHKPYWREKLRSNRARDTKNNEALVALGWKVVRLWEHDVATRSKDCVELILKVASAKRRAHKILGLPKQRVNTSSR